MWTNKLRRGSERRMIRAMRPAVEGLEMRQLLSDIEPNNSRETASPTGIVATAPGHYESTGTVQVRGEDYHDYHRFEAPTGAVVTATIQISPHHPLTTPLFYVLDSTGLIIPAGDRFTVQSGGTFYAYVSAGIDFSFIPQTLSYELSITTSGDVFQPSADIALSSAMLEEGGVRFTYQTSNNPGRFGVRLVRSKDLQFDLSDSVISTQYVTPLPNSTGASYFDLNFTPAVFPDQPYLLVVADPEGLIQEPNESNNTAPVRYRVFDRDVFFQLYQQGFGERLTPSQTDGLNTLLTLIELDRFMDDEQWIAYLLATTKHETGSGVLSWKPADEGILANGKKVAVSYFDVYEPGTLEGSRLGNTKKGDGYRFRGRGYVQLTGRDNYSRLGNILGYGLVDNPDKAFDPVVAYNAMSHGMRFGFGRRDRITKEPQTLQRFKRGNTFDYFGAREIINGDKNAPYDKKNPAGPTKGQVIAGYATRLESILRNTLTRG